MRAIRLLLYFLVSCLLGTMSVLSHATTVQATPNAVTGYVAWDYRSYIGASSDIQSACAAGVAYKSSLGASKYDLAACNVTNNATTGLSVGTQVATAVYNYKGVTTAQGGYAGSLTINVASVGYGCPDSTYTLSGTTCTKPDPCQAGDPVSSSLFAGFATGPKANNVMGADGGPYVLTSLPCDGSCVVGSISLGACGNTPGATIDKPLPISCAYTGVKTGASCSSSSATVPPVPTVATHPPKCAATEGVLTTSSGTVACVPAGTPSNTPTVSTNQKTATFSDGSKQTTTTTTTTDPGTGATNTSSTTTNTGTGGSGTTQGQAGSVGTTTSSGDSSNTKGTSNEPTQKDQQGDCKLEPDAPFCKQFTSPGTADLYTKKDKTLDSILGTFQSTVKGSPIGNASTNFFNVSTPSGGCPAWSVTVPMLNITLDGSAIFCSGTIISAMNAAGAVLLALATYIAFTWAFL